jgi:hypothetical protein
LKRVITLLLHLTIYDFFVKYQHIRRFKSHLRRRITLTTIWRIVGRRKISGRPPVWSISFRAPYAKIVCPRPRQDGQRRIFRAQSLGLQVWVGSSGGRRQCFIAALRRRVYKCGWVPAVAVGSVSLSRSVVLVCKCGRIPAVALGSNSLPRSVGGRSMASSSIPNIERIVGGIMCSAVGSEWCGELPAADPPWTSWVASCAVLAAVSGVASSPLLLLPGPRGWHHVQCWRQ